MSTGARVRGARATIGTWDAPSSPISRSFVPHVIMDPNPRSQLLHAANTLFAEYEARRRELALRNVEDQQAHWEMNGLRASFKAARDEVQRVLDTLAVSGFTADSIAAAAADARARLDAAKAERDARIAAHGWDSRGWAPVFAAQEAVRLFSSAGV